MLEDGIFVSAAQPPFDIGKIEWNEVNPDVKGRVT
jgi:hypothetical protein